MGRPHRLLMKGPYVEEIQDIVEISLIKHGLFNVAKAYKTYRKKGRLRGRRRTSHSPEGRPHITDRRRYRD